MITVVHHRFETITRRHLACLMRFKGSGQFFWMLPFLWFSHFLPRCRHRCDIMAYRRWPQRVITLRRMNVAHEILTTDSMSTMTASTTATATMATTIATMATTTATATATMATTTAPMMMMRPSLEVVLLVRFDHFSKGLFSIFKCFTIWLPRWKKSLCVNQMNFTSYLKLMFEGEWGSTRGLKALDSPKLYSIKFKHYYFIHRVTTWTTSLLHEEPTEKRLTIKLVW